MFIYVCVRRVSLRIYAYEIFFNLILSSDESHGDENRKHTGRSRQDPKARAPQDNPVTFNPPL